MGRGRSAAGALRAQHRLRAFAASVTLAGTCHGAIAQQQCIEWSVRGSYSTYHRTQPEACTAYVAHLNQGQNITYCSPRPGGLITYSLVNPAGACHVGISNPCRDYVVIPYEYTGRWTTCYPYIELQGPSATKALPAGPALAQPAKVTIGGNPGSGQMVRVTLNKADGTIVESSGLTNAAGEYGFTYLPPAYRSVVETFTATCTSCTNTAMKAIAVQACEVCGGE